MKTISRVSIALFGAAILASQCATDFANAQSLDAQTAALKEIKLFAEDLCTTVGTSGKSVEWKASAGATAGLKGLAKFLADLGLSVSAGVDSKTTEGVVQADLARILEAKGNCKLRVFLALQSTMLGPPTPPAPLPKPARPPATTPAPPTPAQQTVELVAFGFPNLWMGMSTQEFAKNKPQNMSLKKGGDWTGLTAGSYDGLLENASLGQYVDGRYLAEFGDGKPTPNLLSKFSYRIGAFYELIPLHDTQPQVRQHPEINCADSAFESAMVMMVSAYGQPKLHQKEPAGSNHGEVLNSLTQFGAANPCSVVSNCTFADDDMLNFREIARWELKPGLFVEVWRHHMGVNLVAKQSPVWLVLDCEEEVSIENRNH